MALWLTGVVCGFGAVAEDRPAAGSLRFEERAAELGLDFRYRHFGTGEKYMPENMAPGVTVLDYDGDGLLDVYLVQGRRWAPAKPEAEDVNRLYRQLEDGRFEDVTARAGVGDSGYGMSAQAGDYDGDGDLDLYVTNYGPNALYENRGDGTFAEVGAAAGVAAEEWGVGAGFFDAEGDGDLDLFVVNYVDFALDNHKWCGNAQSGVRSYCHPDVYDGVGDLFFRNRGDGTFERAGEAAGIKRTPADKGLGVAFADLDGDSRLDVYVANDSTMNYLYLADGEGGFTESALFAGVGFNGSGAAEASMGIGIGDLDADGLPEIFLTHLDQETNTLYESVGPGLYGDATERSGLAAPSLPWVGFGTVFFDHDHDGDLDLFVTNGHIIDNIELFDSTRSHRQPSQLFENRGDGTFVEVSERLGLDEPLVGRGAVAADFDRDGDLDLLLAQNDGPALLLEHAGGPPGPWLTVGLRAPGGNPLAYGATLELHTGERSQQRQIESASSYASQGPAEAHFGLGDGGAPERLEVRWPSGKLQRVVAPPVERRLVLFEVRE